MGSPAANEEEISEAIQTEVKEQRDEVEEDAEKAKKAWTVDDARLARKGLDKEDACPVSNLVPNPDPYAGNMAARRALNTFWRKYATRTEHTWADMNFQGAFAAWLLNVCV